MTTFGCNYYTKNTVGKQGKGKIISTHDEMYLRIQLYFVVHSIQLADYEITKISTHSDNKYIGARPRDGGDFSSEQHQ